MSRFDVILRGGLLYDGTGAPPVRQDIGLTGDRIAAIGDLSAAAAPLTIDAADRWICPGFIDVHSHSDAYQLIEPGAASKLFQGITTEITGNCGASAAPKYSAYTLPSDWLEQTYPREWTTVADYRRLWDDIRPAVNTAMLIGHRTIRAAVMGTADRAATPAEIRDMEKHLEQALDEGGKGLSTGLIYAPAMFATPDEIHALARIAARHHRLYTSHMRSEGRALLDAIDETIAVARATGVRVQISHLKTSGPANWDKCAEALRRIEHARADGLDIAADRYPYTASCTDMDIVLPVWAGQGGREAILARLRDATTRAHIRAELLAARTEDEWGAIHIGSTRHPGHFPYRGKSLKKLSIAWKLHPVDALLRLITDDDLYTGGIFFGMSEDNLWKILAQPWVMIGSDASLRAPWGPLKNDHPHPRAYGTFSKFLNASIHGHTVPPEEAIRKMTSLPADWFRLEKRGQLKEGFFADIAVLDPAQVKDHSTYAEPHQLSTGTCAVFVNGVPTLLDGQPTAKRAGRFLE